MTFNPIGELITALAETLPILIENKQMDLLKPIGQLIDAMNASSSISLSDKIDTQKLSEKFPSDENEKKKKKKVSDLIQFSELTSTIVKALPLLIENNQIALVKPFENTVEVLDASVSPWSYAIEEMHGIVERIKESDIKEYHEVLMTPVSNFSEALQEQIDRIKNGLEPPIAQNQTELLALLVFRVYDQELDNIYQRRYEQEKEERDSKKRKNEA